MSAPTPTPPTHTAGSTHAAPHVLVIPRDYLRPAGTNPRQRFDQAALESLANDIRMHGVLQPLLVRPIPQDGAWEIVAGERRWRAAGIAGLAELPCLVREMSNLEAIHAALAENVQRRDLDPIEEALGYQLALDHGATQAQIAERHQLDASHVSRHLGLLRLPQPVREYIAGRQLSASHGAALAPLAEHPEQCIAIATGAVAEGLNEKALRERVKEMREQLDRARQPGLFRVPLAQEEPTPAPATPAPNTASSAPTGTNGLTRAESDRQFREAQAPDPDVATPVAEARKAREAQPPPAALAPPPSAPRTVPHATRSGVRVAATLDAVDDDWLFDHGLTLDDALDLARRADAYLTTEAVKLLKGLTDAFNAEHPDAPQTPQQRLSAILGVRAQQAGLDIDLLLANPK